MSLDREYRKPVANPFSGVRRTRDGARLFGKSLFQRRASGTAPRGRFRLFHLPNIATGIGEVNLEARAVSKADWPSNTIGERIFIKELLKRHLRYQVDFTMQEAFAGGKSNPGGYAVDFLLWGHIGVETQNEFWHSGIRAFADDETKRLVLMAVYDEILYIKDATLANQTLTDAWFRQNLNI